MLSLLSDGDDYKNGAISDLTGASSFYKALERIDGGKNLNTANELISNVNEDVKLKISFPPTNCFSKGSVSASFIETFYSCPYKCFLKYGVGVKDTLSSEIRSLDFGNILHNVAELFSPRLKEVKSEEDCKKIANELTDKIFEDEKYSRFDFKFAGRLDWDTEGLVIASTDGELIHKITSPKKDMYKTYYVKTALPVVNEELLNKPIILLDGKNNEYTSTSFVCRFIRWRKILLCKRFSI